MLNDNKILLFLTLFFVLSLKLSAQDSLGYIQIIKSDFSNCYQDFKIIGSDIINPTPKSIYILGAVGGATYLAYLFDIY